MNIVQIINKKANGEVLTKEEINFFVFGLMNEQIMDYQISSLLMAIKLKGMTDTETVDYTAALLESGDQLPLNEKWVDKHSSGGIGDKTTIALLPIIGAMGLKVFKISGRGLGFTGGTVDKLESIDGFNVNLSVEDAIAQTNEINISLTAQTPNLVPADGLIYGIRDVTGTVDSPSLIAASIISKKIATGAKNIIIDLKYGTGAFVKNLLDAKELARLLKLIGDNFNRNIKVIITSMNQHLGNQIGNANEVIEAMELLKGNGPKDLHLLVKKIAIELYSQSVKVTLEEASKLFDEVIENGLAFEKFQEWVIMQGGNKYSLEPTSIFKPKNTFILKATIGGYIDIPSVENIGYVLTDLNAGRKVKTDVIDFQAGLKILVKKGEKVSPAQNLIKIYSSSLITSNLIAKVTNLLEIKSKPVAFDNLIIAETKW
ncbi:MAG: thymidine phosphorylase [Mycoplasmataceae bacterium]|nr:thymidine phosphorylase [Mycoplasmataceae bacterium]